MFIKKSADSALAPMANNPFRLLSHVASDFDRLLDESAFPSFRWPSLRAMGAVNAAAWAPDIELFEKDGRLVARVDLPGMKKEDVSVEVADGRMVISGERTQEKEEKAKHFYRTEREYGAFYRTVPLPEGAKLDDVKANFANGVLEVSVPLPVQAETKVKKVAIQEPAKAAKPAA